MKVRDYEVGKLIGESPHMRIYLATDTKNGKEVILKIAKTYEDEEWLKHDVGVLLEHQSFLEAPRILKMSDEDRESFEKARYDLLAAKVVNTFVEKSQGDRRVNVVKLPQVTMAELTPLSKLMAETRIDQRTSVWIFGRLLKFYSIFEALIDKAYDPSARDVGRFNGDLVFAFYPEFSPGNFLISPRNHRVIFYNSTGWGKARTAKPYIKQMAETMYEWVSHNGNENVAILMFLSELKDDGAEDFNGAHHELYDLAGDLWKRGYYPFHYREKDSNIWRTIGEE